MMRRVFWLSAGLALSLLPAPPAEADQGGVVLTGAPAGTTSATDPEIHVSAPAAVSYKYRINGGPYSDELPMQAPIKFSAGVRIGSRSFAAGSRELFEFINLRTTNELTPFVDSVTIDGVESQVQLMYLLNTKRGAVEAENVLNIRGSDVGSLDVALLEKVAAGNRYELGSVLVTGGELFKQGSADSTRRDRKSVV